MEEAENPWNALDDVESIDVKDRTYPVVAAWPNIAGAQEPWQWSSAAIYVPFYRQLCADRRWAEMTYSCDARQTRGGQDDPEWDHLKVTTIIGMNGSTYGLHEYCEHYGTSVYLGKSPSQLRKRGVTHDNRHPDAQGPALSHHFCRPAYRLPNRHSSSRVGVRLFQLTGDNISDVMMGLLTRTFHWPHMGAINVTCSDQFPWRDLFRVHPYGRTLVGAGLIRILICSDPEHQHPYFIIHRKVHARHATCPGSTQALDGPNPPDLIVHYPYMEPLATQGVECMRLDIYHDARVVHAHWKDFFPPSRTTTFPFLDVHNG